MDGLNQNFQSRVVIDTLTQDWHSSPSSGVKRIYLERDNYSEFAKASSIVEYEADSSFQSHTHENGEEFLVLSGTFSDENGDYPSGTYVRNPHGTSHSPFSKTVELELESLPIALNTSCIAGASPMTSA